MGHLKRQNVLRLSAQELERLHAEKNWTALWQQALPLVGFAIKKLIARGSVRSEYFSYDILQEVNLAARRFVESWDPTKGKFSTWVVFNATRQGLNEFTRQANGLVGGRDVKGTACGFDERIQPQRATVPETSEVFHDPVQLADKSELLQKLRSAVGTLHRRERLLLQLLNCNYSIPQAAASMGVSDDTARRIYTGAVARLRHLLDCP